LTDQEGLAVDFRQRERMRCPGKGILTDAKKEKEAQKKREYFQRKKRGVSPLIGGRQPP